MSLPRHTALAALALAALPALGAPTTAGAQDSAATTRVPARTHTVRRGDTLWDLSRAYLGDPFRWPAIYRLNTTVVEDPHWIYPGERLALPDAVAAPVAEASPAVFSPASAVSERATAPERLEPVRRRFAAVRPGEVHAAPFLEREGGPAGAGRVSAVVALSNVRARLGEQALLLNDEVYLAPPPGRAVSVGDRFVTYTLGARLEKLGQMVHPTAIVRIESATPGEAPRARIVQQFGRVLVGQPLLPLDAELPAAGATPSEVAGGPLATVVWIPDEPVLPSLQQYLVLDASARSGARVGDRIALVRPRETRPGELPLPEETIATAQVVRVTPYAATALVVSQVHPAIRRGTRARVTAKMP